MSMDERLIESIIGEDHMRLFKAAPELLELAIQIERLVTFDPRDWELLKRLREIIKKDEGRTL